MQNMKLNFSLLVLTLSTLIVSGQAWQWGLRGGSVNTMQNNTENNIITEMATDQAGNIYTLGIVGSVGLEVDGHPLTAYSSYFPAPTPDVLLSSFKPDGTFRWAKVIGGEINDYGHSLSVNKMGGVYVSGRVYNVDPYQNYNPIHFDTDTVLPRAVTTDTLGRIMFLVKYDTAGAYQWLRMPEPDTVTFANQLARNSFPYRTVVEDNGTVHWFCLLRPGKFSWTNNNIVTQKGIYVLKYDSQGEVTGRVKLEMETDGVGFYNSGNVHFERDAQTGNYYIAGINEGWASIAINGDTLTDRMYMAAFDSTGKYLWKVEGNSANANCAINGLTLDDQGDLYITGVTASNSEFNGYVFNPPGFIGGAPFIMKINALGNLVWAKTSQTTVLCRAFDVTISGSEVAITGQAGNLHWPSYTDTMPSVPNQGYDAFLARFDKTSGDLITMARPKTNFGGASYGYAVAAGPANTYYLGGNFDQQIYLGPDTLFKVGSQRSFFLTQYTCDVPNADFTFTANNATNTLNLNYTGSPADSVVWRLGDGTILKGDSITYSYAAKGYYRVCATAYFQCTEVTACDSLAAGSIGLDEAEALIKVEVYPNPVNEVLYISSSEDEVYDLTPSDISGRKVLEVKKAISIDVSQLPAGTYFLRIEQGQYGVVRKVLVR